MSSLQVGIVGLPNCGKSTLFNALLGQKVAAVAEYPFTTVEPNTGVIEVPDDRLKKLAEMVKPERTIPATVKFIDIAGLVKGAHRGEGLGNKFLSHIRTCDAILHLVRAFSNPSVSRVEGSVDPVSDVEVVNLEMILADFEIVAKKLEEVKKKARLVPQTKKLLETLGKLEKILGEGKLASKAGLSEEEKNLIKELNLLTLKPVIYVLNTDEREPTKRKGLPGSFQALQICAALEAELADFDKQEKKEYLRELGMKKTSLDKLINEAYRLLSLITFYTIKGGKEVHAWSVRKKATALEAAAKVHTDMAKGFIRAEVVNAEVLFSFTGWDKASRQGKLRLEGRNYRVIDGDVIEFRFSL